MPSDEEQRRRTRHLLQRTDAVRSCLSEQTVDVCEQIVQDGLRCVGGSDGPWAIGADASFNREGSVINEQLGKRSPTMASHDGPFLTGPTVTTVRNECCNSCLKVPLGRSDALPFSVEICFGRRASQKPLLRLEESYGDLAGKRTKTSFQWISYGREHCISAEHHVWSPVGQNLKSRHITARRSIQET